MNTLKKVQNNIEKRTSKFSDVQNENMGFLVIAENTKGNLVPLIAEKNKDSVSFFALKNGYKKINTISIETFLNNSKIKAIHGNSKAAKELKSQINSNITLKEKAKVIKESVNRETKVSEVKNVVVNLLVEKLTQNIEDKINNLSEKQKREREETLVVLYKTNKGFKFLTGKEDGDQISLENGKIKIEMEKFVKNENVKGVYGSSELSQKWKKMLKGARMEISLTNKEENVQIIQNINEEMKKPNSEIEGFLKEKSSKSNKKLKR